MTLSYITGATARSGFSAFQLAERGFSAPATAFEGDRGMFQVHCDEDRNKIETVLDLLGQEWRLFGQTYKVVPTETITHGPVECVLAVLPRSAERPIDRMTFKVNPLVQSIADERRDRFGMSRSESESTFDLLHCATAALLRGKFTTAETASGCYADPDVLARTPPTWVAGRFDVRSFDDLGTYGQGVKAGFGDPIRRRQVVKRERDPLLFGQRTGGVEFGLKVHRPTVGCLPGIGKHYALFATGHAFDVLLRKRRII